LAGAKDFTASHGYIQFSVHAESGLAAFHGGGLTASGEVTGPTGLTAAHRTLPFGAKGAGDQCSQWQNGGRAHRGPHAVVE
jgi:hypothetical protein